MSSSPPEFPPPTPPPSGPPPPVPAQVQGVPRHHKLTRRTTSASPTPPPPVPSPVPPALPAPQLQRSPTTSGINTSEEKKRSGSLMRKLTKKRPISLPPAKKHNQPGGVEDRPRLDATRRNEMLPDIQFHARATQDYEMQTYDELGYSLGDIIAVTSADESGKWAGYVVGPAGSRSNSGILYRTYLTLLQRVDSSQSNGNPVFYVEAVYDYRATREDEFNFQAGDIIAVYSTPLGQFWVGANQRARTPSRGKLFPWKLVAPMLAA
ncbi:hypothetical protein FRC18_007559 [Serendipita sp. 400]|nr:hypothetical protein FRC18_007559 [Serendipita sp. 400]